MLYTQAASKERPIYYRRSMAKRTVNDIQEDFNKIGGELIQVEITIEKFKEALTKANNDKNRLTQKLLVIDGEYQKMKYEGFNPNNAVPKEASDELSQTKAPEAPSSIPDQTPTGTV